jgi:homoserine O-acetyltransferase/O-succinyltransferase
VLNVVLFSLLLQAQGGPALPQAKEGDFVARDFRFNSGETLPELRIHYRTLGTPKKDARGIVRNAVLVMHGTGGTGAQFVGRTFAGELFLPGQPLDITNYFIVMPDDIGHGKSSKPSDGLRAKFPRYGYLDMIRAEHMLLTDGLGVNHLRLVMGTSMGGMHTWLWGEKYPDFMDAIRNDPEWQGGNYTKQPQSLRTAAQMLWLVSSNPAIRSQRAPTLAAADKEIDDFVAQHMRTDDANDVLYTFEASADYDPGPELEKITAPLLAVNSADDLVNPPEIGILEKGITRVRHGRAVVIPFSDKTAGHGTHTLAAVWKSYLSELLQQSEHQ